MIEPSLVDVVRASDGLAKPPSPSAVMDGKAVRVLIDDHDIVAAMTGEIARDEADRLSERADTGVPALVLRP